MLPLRLSLQGFLSYKEEQTIDFTGSSLWMLWGPNGVGKSAIFDAITFALYNTHRAVVGNSHNLVDLMNHHSDKLVVEFDFIMSGEIYRVRRTCTRGKNRTMSSTREAFLLQGDDLANLEQMPARPVPETDNDPGFQKWVRKTIGLNYEAFASSVLLLQGKSERLLEANAEKRYATLAELIDLSFYQKLHAKAEKQRSSAKATASALAKQLQGIAHITDADLVDAQATANIKSAALSKAQRQVEHLAALCPQAKQWEAEMAQLDAQKKQLQETLALLQRATEIKDRFSRFELLNQVIPDLKQILSQRERLEQKEKEIPSLERELEQKQRDFSQAATSKVEIEAKLDEIATTLADLLRRKDEAQERLLELSPLVSSFHQIEQQQSEIEKIKQDCSLFPFDLAQQLAQCERQSTLLDEKAQMLPWLQSFAQARAGLASNLKQEQAISSVIEELEKQSQKLCEQQEQKQAERDAADQEERTLGEQKILTAQKLEETTQRLKKFHKASTQPVCSLCGQSISPEHARSESQHLQNEIEAAKALSEQHSTSYEEARVTQQHLKDECKGLVEDLAELSVTIQEQKISQQEVRTRLEQHAEQIRTAFLNMKAAFQQSICKVAPVQDREWLVTRYPTQTELEALQQEVRNCDAQKLQLENLRTQNQDMQKLVDKRMLVEEQLRQILVTTDLVAARNACLEEQNVSKNVEVLEPDIVQKQEDHKRKKLDLQEAEKSCSNLNTSWRESKSQLTTAQATRDNQVEMLQHTISILLLDWQEVALSLNADRLSTLVQECNELAPYKDLNHQLALADHTRETHEYRIQELQESISKIPHEAQRLQQDIQQDLERCKTDRDQVERENDEAKSCLTRLRQQQEHYLDIERQKMEADRQHHLYDLLASLLGREGLQLHLLRQAEHIIIELANTTLAGLSHHRLQLELRGESNTRAQAEKALDLVVYDHDISQRALPAHQISGSQRFRIAVSLALAIGRYTRHNVRQIKSVIIDEGFGSLDKTGRDDMIRELTALGQELELERIILVSHQDEFAAAFPNRYSFSLVDNASRVELFSDD